MPRISKTTKLERVEHIIGSGTGVLDFAVENENGYQTWECNEESDWEIQDVERVGNFEEGRFIFHPDGEFFTCEVESEGEEGNSGPVRCWCERSE